MKKYIVNVEVQGHIIKELRKFHNLSEAENYAYDVAVDKMRMFGGMNGLPDIDSCLNGDGEEVEFEEVLDEAERWMTYEAELYVGSKEQNALLANCGITIPTV